MTTQRRKPLPRLHIGTASDLRPGDTLLTQGPALVLNKVEFMGSIQLDTLSHGTLTFQADEPVSWFRTPR